MFSSGSPQAPPAFGRILCDSRPSRFLLSSGWAPEMTRPPMVELRHDGRVYVTGRAIPPSGGLAVAQEIGILENAYPPPFDVQPAVGIVVYTSGAVTCRIWVDLTGAIFVHSFAGAVPYIDFDFEDYQLSWYANGLRGQFAP